MLEKKLRLPSSVRFKNSFIVSEKEFLMKTQQNTLLFNRFGFVVGKSVDILATERNNLKRRFRAIFEKMHFVGKEGYDILFILKPAAKTCVPDVLLIKIKIALGKAEII